MARTRRNSKNEIEEVQLPEENIQNSDVKVEEPTQKPVENHPRPAAPTQPPQQTTSTTDPRRRSLSIAEIISLASSQHRASSSHTASAATTAAVNNLNLPESLRAGLMKADSPILNALIPLIRQKLAVKTAEAAQRRNSTEDGSSPSLSLSSRRSSTSSRSEDHRNSHKLAERKRRKEMKDVFDALRDSLPPGARKSSKWEILIEAADEIDRLAAMENNLLKQRDSLLQTLKQQQQQQQ